MISPSKKTAHASEQERPDVAARRQAWFDAQPDLDPEDLVFIDETGASTKMPRFRGRAPRGQRFRAPIPHGHVGTPAPVQEEFQDRLSRSRLLPCVRPLVRRACAAGPYGSSRIGSTSLERARSATHAPGSSNPVSPTL